MKHIVCSSCFFNLPCLSALNWNELSFVTWQMSHWRLTDHGERVKSLLPTVSLINFPFWMWCCWGQENKSGAGAIAQPLRVLAMQSCGLWLDPKASLDPRIHITSAIKSYNSSSKWSDALFHHLSMCRHMLLYTHHHTHKRSLLNMLVLCLREEGCRVRTEWQLFSQTAIFLTNQPLVSPPHLYHLHLGGTLQTNLNFAF